jgi:beta-phosphoglucomutase-like phosphatase (HAD superfamily)
MGLAWRLESEIPVFFVPLVGALEAVAGLRALGLRLFVASAAPSSYVRRCLEIAGLLGSFEAVFGPDVVDGLKCGPEFYRRAFRMAALEPEQCLVVDDSPGPLAWAREAGALAVGVGWSEPDPDHAAPSFVRTLKELPSMAAAAGDFPELVGGGAGRV